MKINKMRLFSSGILCILLATVCSFNVSAAFFEETLEGAATNISDNFIYINDTKVDLPAFVIENINEGDLVVFGAPEPLLTVHDEDKISYGYGDVFHFKDSIQLTNGITVQKLDTEILCSNSSGLGNVSTYFRVTKNSDSKEIVLNPGEYTIIWDTVIAVHEAKEPVELIFGPQHWYVYEIKLDQKAFSNKDLEFVNTELKQKQISSLLLVLLIFLFIPYYFLKQRV
ncbi:MAG: hypothetical protein PHV51_05045 [Methanosarcinaceae archaeon]|nr:hypothetical protein [Methanosarcinaceae archaeon]MDD4497504.1 hypothetical protein [Methanosarcinaceae archaeon]